MNEKNIKQMSSWPALESALKALVDSGAASVPDAVFAAVADRIRSAIEAPSSDRIVQAAEVLEAFYREAAAAAPAAVRDMTRRFNDDAMLNAAYFLGKASFAQLLASRVADTRTDDRFISYVRDKRYLPYLKALSGAPLSVAEVERRVGQRLETASRKLGVLRSLGLVVSRKEGTTVMNSLSPAARAILEHSGLAEPEQAQGPASEDAKGALDHCRKKLPDHLRSPANFPVAFPMAPAFEKQAA